MRQTILALSCLLSGCGYLGTAREWDPASADAGFLQISGLAPVRQEKEFGCGPAALKMVLRYYGEPVEGEPVEDRGVAVGSLRDQARERGFRAHVVEGTFEDLEEHLRK